MAFLSNDKLQSLGLFWLRLLSGAGIAIHGYGKLFGGHMAGFAMAVRGMGFPAPTAFAWAAALSEFLGGILIALGLKTRIAALLVFITMGVAAFVAQAADPLSRKELALAYFAISGALILTGPGGLSLDRA